MREAIDYGGQLCQSLAGEVLEAFVIERLLQVVSPASLELSLAAVKDIERERDQRIEYERFQQDTPDKLTETQRQEIHSLSQRLPELWRAESTTAEDRCTIARLLIDQVVVHVEGDTERVDVDIHWHGGFESHHALRRPVQTYEQLSYYDELLSRIRALLEEGQSLRSIAACLTSEGYRPPKRSSQFTAGILTRFLRDRGIRTGRLPKSVTHQNHLGPDEWWLVDLASKLQMPIATLHRWQRVGWITSRKVTAAHRWAVFADADELNRLKQLRDQSRGWPDPYPRELITPKPNPNETENPANKPIQANANASKI